MFEFAPYSNPMDIEEGKKILYKGILLNLFFISFFVNCVFIYFLCIYLII
jgi:hypothetical protein